MSKNIIEKMNNKLGRTVSIMTVALIFVGVVLFFLVIILTGITDDYVIGHEVSQRKYCKQLANTVRVLYENGSTDEDVVAYMQEYTEASGSSWSFLYDSENVIFAKNTTTTALYLKDDGTGKSDFMDELHSQEAIISLENFEVGEQYYTVGVITAKEDFLIAGNTKIYTTYLAILFAVTAMTGLGVIVHLADAWGKSEKKLDAVSRELKERNEDFERVQNDIESLEHFTPASLKHEMEEENARFRQYKFKFYLNARHAIYINGVLGAMHPHTWEITMNVIKMDKSFIEFNKLEKKIETFMSKYQDGDMNDIEPFDVINPTLENCCDYFKDELSKILNAEGWILLMMEMSETPSRSYVISMIDEDDVDQEVFG